MFRNPLIDAIVVLLVVLLIFGPKRLPGLGKSLGHGMREFKDGITGSSKPDEEEQQQPQPQPDAGDCGAHRSGRDRPRTAGRGAGAGS